MENIKNSKLEAINRYSDIVQDIRGIMYFANIAGVYEYDGLHWELIELPEKAKAQCFSKSEKGRIYVGGEGEIGYLAPNRDGEMVYVSLISKVPEQFKGFKNKIVKIEQTDKDVVFFCDIFILKMDKKTEGFTGIPAFSYFYSSVSSNNKIFVIDEQTGLMSLEKESLVKVPGGENLVSYFMMPYENNKILIISPNEGMISYNIEENKFIKLGREILNYDIKSGAELSNGNFALGSVNNGCIITNHQGKELYKINTESGTLDNMVFCVEFTKQGDLWIGTSKGISLVFEKEKQSETTSAENSDFRTNIRSCTRRGDESVVFGGAYVNVADSVQSLTQPEEQYKKFHYTDNSFRFTFASTRYHGVANFKYRYFLEGFDQDWTTWTDRPYSEYTNLSFDKYVLKVMTQNEKGEESEIGIYSFEIEIPWYESWWFFAAQIGFIVTLLTVAIVMYRSGRSEKIAGKLITLAVVIIFEYMENVVSPVFELLAVGVAATMFLSSVIVATIISPIEDFANRMIRKIVKRKE